MSSRKTGQQRNEKRKRVTEGAILTEKKKKMETEQQKEKQKKIKSEREDSPMKKYSRRDSNPQSPP